MLTAYFEDYLDRYRPYKGGAWCYEDGCIYRGLELLHRHTGEDRWLNRLKAMVDAQIEPGPTLSGYAPGEFNIDNILPGRALLYLHQVTQQQTYLDAASLLMAQLQQHPRTKTGVYWHKLRYPWQVWLDGLYMGLPFQIGYGQQTGQADLIHDALHQLDTALALTFVPETGLYAHAYDEAKEQAWAHPDTGRSAAHWARALGWLSMALVDVADLVTASAFMPAKARTERLLADIQRLQQPSGQWLQVIDHPDLPGNYLESSASAMFVYALVKGAELGLCPAPEHDLFARLTSSALRTTADGRTEMVDMCEVAGLGTYQNRYRNGTAEYYVSEARVADDAKGVGPLMMGHAITGGAVASETSLAG